MRNTRQENVMEHSAIVSMFAYSLAVLHNKLTAADVNAERVGMIALFHETGEVMTGDMPTPVKYFNSEIAAAYKDIERRAEDKLTATLPNELLCEITSLFNCSGQERLLVKYADKLAAYVKCKEELAQGNGEFKEAEKSIAKTLKEYGSPAVDYFIEHFVTAYGLSLDKLSEHIS